MHIAILIVAVRGVCYRSQLSICRVIYTTNSSCTLAWLAVAVHIFSTINKERKKVILLQHFLLVTTALYRGPVKYLHIEINCVQIE